MYYCATSHVLLPAHLLLRLLKHPSFGAQAELACKMLISIYFHHKLQDLLCRSSLTRDPYSIAAFTSAPPSSSSDVPLPHMRAGAVLDPSQPAWWFSATGSIFAASQVKQIKWVSFGPRSASTRTAFGDRP